MGAKAIDMLRDVAQMAVDWVGDNGRYPAEQKWGCPENSSWSGFHADKAKEALAAIAEEQPQADGAAERIAELTKERDDLRAKVEQQEKATQDLITRWSENAKAHRERLEFLSEWLLNRIVERARGAS